MTVDKLTAIKTIIAIVFFAYRGIDAALGGILPDCPQVVTDALGFFGILSAAQGTPLVTKK